jgi:cyclohexanone monooxygenase
VDTNGRGVERITEDSVIANGQAYKLDCLIYATGFEVGTEYARRAGYEIYGRGGQSMSEKWESGVRTLHGMLTRNFPNCFIISGTQSGFTANYPHMLNEQSKHIAYIIKEAQDRQALTVEPSAAAEEAWVETIKSLAMMRENFQRECTPGYYNNEGQPSPLAAQNGFYGAGPIAFVKVIEDWRAKGTLPGLELGGR